MNERPKLSPRDKDAETDQPAKLRDFSKSLPMSLLRAREAAMRHFRPSLRHFGLTEQQWRVLRALSATSSSEILALAETTFLLAPSLSRLLKGLDERGLIVRRTSDVDMRRGIVSISEKGLQLIERVGGHSEQIYAEMTRRFGAKRLASLQAELGALEAALLEGDPIGEQYELVPEPLDMGARPNRGRPRKDAAEEEES
jgi:homoprotocatechuate degradation regulator HpaR